MRPLPDRRFHPVSPYAIHAWPAPRAACVPSGRRQAARRPPGERHVPGGRAAPRARDAERPCAVRTTASPAAQPAARRGFRRSRPGRQWRGGTQTPCPNVVPLSYPTGRPEKAPPVPVRRRSALHVARGADRPLGQGPAALYPNGREAVSWKWTEGRIRHGEAERDRAPCDEGPQEAGRALGPPGPMAVAAGRPAVLLRCERPTSGERAPRGASWTSTVCCAGAATGAGPSRTR